MHEWVWFGPESRLIRMFSSMLRRWVFFPQLSLRRTWHQGTFELLFRLSNLATVSSCKRVHHCQMSPWPFGELFLWDCKKGKKNQTWYSLPTRHAASQKKLRGLDGNKAINLSAAKQHCYHPKFAGSLKRQKG